MPVVQFSADVAAPVELMHAMLYPGDVGQQAAMTVVHHLGFVLTQARDDDAIVSVRAGDLRVALDMPSRQEIRKDREQRQKRATIAGELLNMLFLMNHFNLQPSINRAIYALQAWAPSTAFGDGTPLPESETAIRKYWNEFSRVAHYWAALRINKGYSYTGDRLAFTPEGFPKFLSVAATLYDFGVAFIPLGHPKPTPVLDSATAYAPPVGTPRSKFNPAKPPDGLSGLLADYKAPTPNLPTPGTR
jgi:hypothetical protein